MGPVVCRLAGKLLRMESINSISQFYCAFLLYPSKKLLASKPFGQIVQIKFDRYLGYLMKFASLGQAKRDIETILKVPG